MGLTLDVDFASKYWSKADIAELKTYKQFSKFFSHNGKSNPIVSEKVSKAIAASKRFLFKDWVRFISVTGSVAAGNPRETDDIDMFIVVKDYRSWIYRLILKLKANDLRRYGDTNFQNTFCVNFICEERALLFEQQNIFTLHEMLRMIPIYNEDFYKEILGANQWIERFHIPAPRLNTEIKSTEGIIKKAFYRLTNFFAFASQLSYMLLSRHKADVSRLIHGYQKGDIRFYPKDFNQEKLNNVKLLYREFLPASATTATEATTTKSTASKATPR
ncbi:hypothetical protein H6764_03120 [Candidatus Nomurabacteria bacterium]|nr:hypothetical protein [Candidatus Nomurabacteria bacterium]